MKTITAFVAPHRMGFLLGSILLLASLGWWSIEMLARQQGISLDMALPPMFLHGYLMLYGFFPLFMLGFIYTAGPRWLNVASPNLYRYIPIMLAYGSGTLLVLAGGWLNILMACGILLHAIGWLCALIIWVGRIRASKADDRKHGILIALAFFMGLVGQIIALVWFAGREFALWQACVEIGLWGFLLPVFLSVSHRMIPFFSASVLPSYSVWKPVGLLYALIGLSWAHAAVTLWGGTVWPIDLILACLLAYSVWRWGVIASFRVPLLAMLHAAFAWSSVALLLYAVQGWMATRGVYVLGFAPLHALALGFFATMLLGFVTRVSLGHSGRPLVAGRLAWTLYWLVHGVAATRVVADIVPGWQQQMYLISAGGALLAFMLWGSRFVPIYLRPRIDGKEG